MRLPRTLSLYVLREAVVYALIGLFAIGSVLLTQNILQRLDDLTGLGAGASDILAVVACLTVILGSYSIPVAVLFGVLVSVGRLSSDSEVKAMRALGVSLAQFSMPFIALGAGVALLTGYLLYEVEPAARRELRAVMSDVATRGGIIRPRAFNELGNRNRLLFVETRSEDNELTGVLIADRTNPDQPFTVVAEAGRFRFDHETAIAHLELRRGDIHFEQADVGDSDYQRIGFDDFHYAVDMSTRHGAGFHRLRPREMSTFEIRQVLGYFQEHGKPPPAVRDKKRWRYETQLQRRLALPFAPVLFALIGVPLGLRPARGARSWGALLCVALVFGYYALLSVGVYLAENQILPASISLWLPNAVFAVVGSWLMLRARRAEA